MGQSLQDTQTAAKGANRPVTLFVPLRHTLRPNEGRSSRDGLFQREKMNFLRLKNFNGQSGLCPQNTATPHI